MRGKVYDNEFKINGERSKTYKKKYESHVLQEDNFKKTAFHLSSKPLEFTGDLYQYISSKSHLHYHTDKNHRGY